MKHRLSLFEDCVKLVVNELITIHNQGCTTKFQNKWSGCEKKNLDLDASCSADLDANCCAISSCAMMFRIYFGPKCTRCIRGFG